MYKLNFNMEIAIRIEVLMITCSLNQSLMRIGHPKSKKISIWVYNDHNHWNYMMIVILIIMYITTLYRNI